MTRMIAANTIRLVVSLEGREINIGSIPNAKFKVNAMAATPNGYTFIIQ